MVELIAWLKDFTPGAAGIWTLVVMGLVAWWQGLPKLIDAWEKRSSGIEARLQAGMQATLNRYEEEFVHLEKRFKESDDRHRECEARSERQVERINKLEQDIIGFQRQLAAQDIAAAGHLNLDNAPATKAMIERLKVIK